MSDAALAYQKRIGYEGYLEPLLSQVCIDFELGTYVSYTPIIIGYEDFNVKLATTQGNFCVKFFSKFRDARECQRYIQIIEKVLEAGIGHPKLFLCSNSYLYTTKIGNTSIHLCVMEYVEGKSFYQLNAIPTHDEMNFIIKQVALINQLDLHPYPLYDSWAIPNFLKEYNEKAQNLNGEDKDLLQPFKDKFSKLDIDELPHCFVHGDITKTNTMRSNDGKIYILDFAVANIYPRIQEIAMLLCDLFSDAGNEGKFKEAYEVTLNEYEKYIPLTQKEKEVLPEYIQFAHAMHLLCANYEKVVNHNNSAENEFFMTSGRFGLMSYS